MFEIGDIVTLTRHPGRWVIARRDDTMVPALRWHVVCDVDTVPIGLTVGDGDLELVERRTFAVGQKITYWDDTGVVLSDDGATVKIAVKQTRPRALDHLNGRRFYRTRTQHEIQLAADRAVLVAMNI